MVVCKHHRQAFNCSINMFSPWGRCNSIKYHCNCQIIQIIYHTTTKYLSNLVNSWTSEAYFNISRYQNYGFIWKAPAPAVHHSKNILTNLQVTHSSFFCLGDDVCNYAHGCVPSWSILHVSYFITSNNNIVRMLPKIWSRQTNPIMHWQKVISIFYVGIFTEDVRIFCEICWFSLYIAWSLLLCSSWNFSSNRYPWVRISCMCW